MHPAARDLLFVLARLLLVLLALCQRQRRLQREAYIRHAMLPRGLFAALRQQHPHLSDKDCPLVAQALRQFFQTYLHGGRRPVSMPSRVVDDLWHAFILHTRTYQQFCNQTFGRFLHHTPAVVLGASATPMPACGAASGTPAATTTSTRAAPSACCCCLPPAPS